MNFYYKPYIPVAQRRAKALKKIAQLKKQGIHIQPVETQGRQISNTVWGNAWCNHMENFCDMDNRLSRGRTYVRNGSVCHLHIAPHMINAKVIGSELYNVKIQINPLQDQQWQNIKHTCSGQVHSILELLQGTVSSNVMNIVTDPKNGLMPCLNEMQFNCDCPDWAHMCKHIAAVLYGVGTRLDTKPELLFELRAVDPSELIDTIDIANTDTTPELDNDLTSLFGIDIESSTPPPTPTQKTKPKAKTKAKTPSNTKTKSQTIKTKTTSQQTTAVKPFKPTKTAIKQLRKRFGLNKTQFAQLISVSPKTITLWEDKSSRVNLKPTSEKALIQAASLTKDQAWKKIGLLF